MFLQMIHIHYFFSVEALRVNAMLSGQVDIPAPLCSATQHRHPFVQLLATVLEMMPQNPALHIASHLMANVIKFGQDSICVLGCRNVMMVKLLSLDWTTFWLALVVCKISNR